MPFVLCTVERREENSAKRGGVSLGLREDVFKGMAADGVVVNVREIERSLLNGAGMVLLSLSVLMD